MKKSARQNVTKGCTKDGPDQGSRSWTLHTHTEQSTRYEATTIRETRGARGAQGSTGQIESVKTNGLQVSCGSREARLRHREDEGDTGQEHGPSRGLSPGLGGCIGMKTKLE